MDLNDGLKNHAVLCKTCLIAKGKNPDTDDNIIPTPNNVLKLPVKCKGK